MKLGYDDTQITGYALNLSQVQIQQATASYDAIAPTDGTQSPSLANQLAPLGDFLKDVFSALGVAGQFSDPKHLLLDMTKKMADNLANDNKQPSALAQFLERILAADGTPVVAT